MAVNVVSGNSYSKVLLLDTPLPTYRGLSLPISIMEIIARTVRSFDALRVVTAALDSGTPLDAVIPRRVIEIKDEQMAEVAEPWLKLEQLVGQ